MSLLIWALLAVYACARNDMTTYLEKAFRVQVRVGRGRYSEEQQAASLQFKFSETGVDLGYEAEPSRECRNGVAYRGQEAW